MRGGPHDRTEKTVNISSWRDIKRDRLDAEQIDELRERAARDVLEMHLETLCEELGLAQAELAALVDAKQPRLAKFEDQSDFLLSTLRRSIEAQSLDSPR
jgi:predicted XRE-type DNA-binding protein